MRKKIREMLESEVLAMSERHDQDVSVYEKGSSLAPAFGMIGNPGGTGKHAERYEYGWQRIQQYRSGYVSRPDYYVSMAVFYQTWYLSLWQKKLRLRNDEELLYKQIIIEGVLSIQAGDNPKYLEEKLLSYLSRHNRIRS